MLKALFKDKDKFQDHDRIMADRGIVVQDLFASPNVQVNITTMIKGKKGKSQYVVVHRRIASKRIHTERILALQRHTKLLKKELPVEESNIGLKKYFHLFFHTQLETLRCLFLIKD